MTTTQVSNLDASIQKTIDWLDDVQQHKPLKADDRRDAYQALRAVLPTLRDQLTIEEATDLGAQVPHPVRGIYYEGWNPTQCPISIRDRDAFLDAIREKLPEGSGIKPYAATRAVLGVLRDRVTSGEIQDVKALFNEDLRDLWPEVD